MQGRGGHGAHPQKATPRPARKQSLSVILEGVAMSCDPAARFDRLPPMNVQNAIAEMVNQVSESVAAHEQARQAAVELRESLMQLFFSGHGLI